MKAAVIYAVWLRISPMLVSTNNINESQKNCRFPNQHSRSTINPIAAATKAQTLLPPGLSSSAAPSPEGPSPEGTGPGVKKEVLTEVDVPDEADEALEDGVVVAELCDDTDAGNDTDAGDDTDVGDDMDAGEVSAMVEVPIRE